MSTVSVAKPQTAAATAVWPQVDLLPPEVRQARRLKRTKQHLLVVLLALVLVVMLGWVYAKITQSAATHELATAQAETGRLTAEQAKYAGVPQIQAQVAATKKALSTATSTEVVWKQYLEALRAVTPPTVSYESLQVTLSSDPTAMVAGAPLQQPSIGQIVFTARAAKLPDIAAWMDAVGGLQGLSDPWFTQASATDDKGYTYYKVTGSVQVTSAALAHRFDAATKDGSTAGTAPAASSSAPTNTPSTTPTGGNS